MTLPQTRPSWDSQPPKAFPKSIRIGSYQTLGSWMGSWSSNTIFCWSWDSFSPFCLLFPEEKKKKKKGLTVPWSHGHKEETLGCNDASFSKDGRHLQNTAPALCCGTRACPDPIAKLSYLTPWHVDKVPAEAINHFGTFPGHGSPW